MNVYTWKYFVNKLLILFKRRELWTIGIYKLPYFDLYDFPVFNDLVKIGESGIRKNKDYQSVAADPFLFSKAGVLYLFYEAKTDFCVGEIWLKSFTSDGSVTCHGCVLKESFHLSYPQVVEFDGVEYMLPESASSGKVLLYKADSFPEKWSLARVLIDKPLVDPSLVVRPEGLYLLATTPDNDMKLYFSKTIHDEFIDCGHIISNEIPKAKSARNAGRPIDIGNELCRLYQDCSVGYGKSIGIKRIENISVSKYEETDVTDDIFKIRPKWMREGYHHLSIVKHDGFTYVAIDGKCFDSYVNTVMLLFIKIYYYFISR